MATMAVDKLTRSNFATKGNIAPNIKYIQKLKRHIE